MCAKQLLYLSLLLLCCFSSRLSAQTEPATAASIVLHGKILDARTKSPLSYATISVNKLGIGIASNADGNYTLQLPASSTDQILTATFMGYSTRSYKVSDLTDNGTILLEPKSYQMNEVVVTNRDFCKEFLKKAWDAIPDNYPAKPTLCQGFYRETQRLKDSTFLYFNEAVLDVYKNTYKNVTNFGQIRVEKSRKNVFPGIDTINDVRFYGGPHFPNDLDIAFSRWDFINPSEYKNWSIKLAGSYRDSLSTVYVLTFKHKKMPNSNFQGKMFVDKDSYAFIGFDFWRPGAANIVGARQPDMPYIPGMTSVKIAYKEMNGVYHLSYINYKTNGVNTASNQKIFKDIDYVTTSIQTEDVKPIPFDQQFDYTDILSIEAQPYDSSYWKDYNILEQSSIMDKQATLSYQKDEALQHLTQTYNRELTQEEKTLLFLKRFTFDGGFAYLPVKFNGGVQSIGFENHLLGTKNLTGPSFGLSTMDGVRFEMTKKWFLVGTISTALYGISQFKWDLGASYRLPLTRNGRFLCLDLGLAAGGLTSGYELGTFNNTGSIVLGGKTFDSRKITVKTGSSSLGLKPSLGFSVRMGKKYELFTDASWYQALLFKKDYFQFREADGGIFSRKKVRCNWDDSRLQYSVNGVSIHKQPLDIAPWNIRLGIRSGF